MRKYRILSYVMLVSSVFLAVVSLFILPESVVIQLSVGNTNATTAPRLLAISIPSALGVGGSLFSLFNKGDERSRMKSLIVSVVGIIVFIVMIVVNI